MTMKSLVMEAGKGRVVKIVVRLEDFCKGACIKLLMTQCLQAALVEEMEAGKGRVVKITGIKDKGRTATVLLR